MSFIIDTCVISELSRSEPAPQVVAWFKGCPPELLFMSVITLGELHFGIARLPDGRKKNDLMMWLEQVKAAYRDYILPVGDRIGIRWGEERAQLEKAGVAPPVVDSLLAATALELDFVLVTRNVRDFRSFNIRLLDPWAES